MADEFTTAGSFGTPGNRSAPDADKSKDVPEGKQVNGFTGELEDAAPDSIAPAPIDQVHANMFPTEDLPNV